MSSNPFEDYQQQFTKMWTDNMKNIPGMESYAKMYENMSNVPGMTAFAKMYDSFMPKTQNGYWDNFTAFMPRPENMWNVPVANNFWTPFAQIPGMENFWKMYSGIVPNTQDFFKSFTAMLPDSQALLSMMPYKFPGIDTLAKFADIWKGLDNPENFVRDFQDNYIDLMEDVLKNFLPEGAVMFLEQPKALMDSFINFYQQTLAPFMKVDESILERIASGDITAYPEFFRDFSKNYEESIEKYFNIMGMGLNREANEDAMKAMNAYIKAMIASCGLASMLLSTSIQSMQTLAQKYQEALAEGKVFTTFRDSYDLWYSVTEDALVELLNTEEFAKCFGDFSDKYAKYMIAMNKEYERMLAALPIPTNTDMKSLYKTIYDLRKEVRDLKRELTKLEEANEKAAK